MSSTLPSYVQPLGHGVFAVDTGFHRENFDAAYLMVQNGRGAFIDTGTNYSVPRFMSALQAVGLEPGDVDWVIPTHVHLDHAGGVGLLMSQLPNARLMVHPRGAKHMIDPSALWAGATEVYGPEEMARSYGELLPVPAERVQQSSDGLKLDFAGRELLFIDTPGHAKHHHCIWDPVSQGWFTGDTFGISYREFDTAQGAWIIPTSTPVQFEPDALRTSVQRLLAQNPQCMYLTHYSRVQDVPRLGALVLHLLEETVALARQLQHADNRHEALKAAQFDLFVRSLAEHGCTLSRTQVAELLAIDLELNAQGIAVWLDRPAKN